MVKTKTTKPTKMIHRADTAAALRTKNARMEAALTDAGEEELAIIQSGNKAALRWYQLARTRTEQVDAQAVLLKLAEDLLRDYVERNPLIFYRTWRERMEHVLLMISGNPK